MYEQFRNEMQLALSEQFGPDDVCACLNVLDTVAYRYKFTRDNTELAIANDNFDKLVKMYIASRAIEGLSPGTLRNYYFQLSILKSKIRKDPMHVTTNDIRVYLYNYKIEREVSDRSLDKIRQYISTFFEWLCEEGYIDKNPCAKVNKIRHEIKQRCYISQEELEYIRKACKDPRERAMIEFLYSTGCRASELCEVKLSDISNDYTTVALFGKGKKHRQSYINAKCKVAILDYLEVREQGSEYLFASHRYPYGKLSRGMVTQIVKNICNKASTPSGKTYTPHHFRHTTATTALQNGMPVQEVQRLLGHAKIDTTMIYAECNQNDIRTDHNRTII